MKKIILILTLNLLVLPSFANDVVETAGREALVDFKEHGFLLRSNFEKELSKKLEGKVKIISVSKTIWNYVYLLKDSSSYHMNIVLIPNEAPDSTVYSKCLFAVYDVGFYNPAEYNVVVKSCSNNILSSQEISIPAHKVGLRSHDPLE